MQVKENSGTSVGVANTLPTGKAMWAILGIMLASNLLASINQSLVNIALDQVAKDYDISLSVANWLVLGFTIVAATLITMGASILKHFGLRKSMIFGFIASLVGAVLGLFAFNFWMMFAARLIEAITVGLFFPIVTSVVLTLAPEGRKATLLAINSGVIGIGLAAAPVLSGLMITYFNLNSIYLVPLVLSAILLVVGIKFLKDIYQRENQRIDLVSVVLSFAGLGLFIYGLNIVTRDLLPAFGFMAMGVIVLGLFVWRQFSIPKPLLDLTPFKHKKFAIGEIIMMAGYMGSIFMSLLIPLYLEGVAGYTAFLAGALLCLPILCYSASCYIGGRLEDKYGIWPLVPFGFALLLTGYVAMNFTASDKLIAPMLVCVAVCYFGVGLVFPTLKAADLNSLPRELNSFGSSIHSTLVQLASSVGSALFVGVMSAKSDVLMGKGVSKASAYAAGFSDTVVIAIVLIAVALAASTAFAYVMRKRTH